MKAHPKEPAARREGEPIRDCPDCGQEIHAPAATVKTDTPIPTSSPKDELKAAGDVPFGNTSRTFEATQTSAGSSFSAPAQRDAGDAKDILNRILTGHRMTGSNPEAPIEKICECGRRFIGLLQHDTHQRDEQLKVVEAALLAEGSK